MFNTLVFTTAKDVWRGWSRIPPARDLEIRGKYSTQPRVRNRGTRTGQKLN